MKPGQSLLVDRPDDIFGDPVALVFLQLVVKIVGLLPEREGADKRQLAVSMLAEMTGAVAAARAVSDPALSDEILTSARRSLR